ncbi:hypothetical protein POVCU2_0047290 [Plasmodium ovale curtisi]|uniref:Uncharacterized protein n=1 Tax=Plasmodium ovale curtisi TaxID=864141 RepID=A0A1A8W634_PLAOA|nr:hypothetical protein POVCU2_0047290 [Plasmodium ovale curtisi]
MWYVLSGVNIIFIFQTPETVSAFFIRFPELQITGSFNWLAFEVHERNKRGKFQVISTKEDRNRRHGNYSQLLQIPCALTEYHKKELLCSRKQVQAQGGSSRRSEIEKVAEEAKLKK